MVHPLALSKGPTHSPANGAALRKQTNELFLCFPNLMLCFISGILENAVSSIPMNESLAIHFRVCTLDAIALIELQHSQSEGQNVSVFQRLGNIRVAC